MKIFQTQNTQGITEIMCDSYAGHMVRRYCSGRIGGMTKEINNWV